MAKGALVLATHWLLLLPMLVLPGLFLVRLSARALELLAQKRLQLPRKSNHDCLSDVLLVRILSGPLSFRYEQCPISKPEFQCISQ